MTALDDWAGLRRNSDGSERDRDGRKSIPVFFCCYNALQISTDLNSLVRSMINKPSGSLTIADIESLIANGVRESRDIEYKLKLPGNSDDEKKEFLADVSSFANAIGGDILYGISESDGVPVSIEGLNDFDEDKERLRLEAIIRNGIEPRIQGLELCVFRTTPDNKAVLLIRVPRSRNCSRPGE